MQTGGKGTQTAESATRYHVHLLPPISCLLFLIVANVPQANDGKQCYFQDPFLPTPIDSLYEEHARQADGTS